LHARAQRLLALLRGRQFAGALPELQLQVRLVLHQCLRVRLLPLQRRIAGLAQLVQFAEAAGQRRQRAQRALFHRLQRRRRLLQRPHQCARRAPAHQGKQQGQRHAAKRHRRLQPAHRRQGKLGILAQQHGPAQARVAVIAAGAPIAHQVIAAVGPTLFHIAGVLQPGLRQRAALHALFQQAVRACQHLAAARHQQRLFGEQFARPVPVQLHAQHPGRAAGAIVKRECQVEHAQGAAAIGRQQAPQHRVGVHIVHIHPAWGVGPPWLLRDVGAFQQGAGGARDLAGRIGQPDPGIQGISALQVFQRVAPLRRAHLAGSGAGAARQQLDFAVALEHGGIELVGAVAGALRQALADTALEFVGGAPAQQDCAQQGQQQHRACQQAGQQRPQAHRAYPLSQGGTCGQGFVRHGSSGSPKPRV